jgi:C-terminal processing protease CtpA/Prc
MHSFAPGSPFSCIDALRTLRLKRGAKGFGFAVVGQNEQQADAAGVYVSFIHKNGSAGLDGRLAVGDQIVSINGINMMAASASLASSCLSATDAEVVLEVQRNEQGFAPYRKQARMDQTSIRRTEERRKRKSKRHLQATTKARRTGARVHRYLALSLLSLFVLPP